MGNARSRRNNRINGDIFIHNSVSISLSKYVTFSNEVIQEDRDKHWKNYMRQEVKSCKNGKSNRQQKGIQKI